MLSSPRLVPVLKGVIVVCVVGLIVLAGLFVRFVVVGGLGDNVPRSEVERGVFAAEEAVQANPKNADARIRLAAAYIERNSPRQAIEQAQLAIRLEPKNPAAYYVLGLAQTKLGQNDAAVVSLVKAANTQGQQAPFYQDAFTALARAYERAGDDKKAIDSFTKAINFNPENSLLLYERGQYFERKKDWKMALYDYGWALTYAPNYQPARDRFDAIAKDHPKELKEIQSSITAQTQGLQPAQGSNVTTGTK